MPIENERKIVLDNANTEGELAIDNSYMRKIIKQGYIGINRIRMVQDNDLLIFARMLFGFSLTDELR